MRILKEETLGLIIDIQEKLFPHIDSKEQLIRSTEILLQGLKILEIPLFITEQYPKGLGPTIEQVKLHIDQFNPVEKISFSCCDEANLMDDLEASGKKNIIICGIEAHVCVLQTTIDLLERNYIPVVISDCISSRKPGDKMIALERMRSEGAIISTYESILFELARIAGNDAFKMISKLVK